MISKKEVISIVQTFSAVFVTVLVTNIDLLDFENLSKGTLLAFGIAVFRSLVKALWFKYFPNALNS